LFGPSDRGYVVNPWGGIPVPELDRIVENRTASGSTRWSNTAHRLSFEDWRRVTRWDLLSVQCAQARVRLSDDWVLELAVDPEQCPVKALPLKEVAEDFFGQTMDPAETVVGPFREWPARRTFVLRP
jgi:hypothetical protein